MYVFFAEHRARADQQCRPVLGNLRDDRRSGGGAEGDLGHRQTAFQQGVGQGQGRLDRLDRDHRHHAIVGNFRKY